MSKIIYLAIKDKCKHKHKVSLVTDADCTHLLDLPCIIYPYTTESGRTIVKVRVTPKLEQVLQDLCDGYEIDKKPLTKKAFKELKMGNIFIGYTRESVIEKFPEMAGNKEIDNGDGSTTVVPLFPNKKWSFED
ncbi:unnamed protein product [marine sediment metagenome]|uniref:Uncharacterized protein n=1 Tax=marine sediment metagenome TaxID=412755 RepID=X0SD06_9ZZZZ